MRLDVLHVHGVLHAWRGIDVAHVVGEVRKLVDEVAIGLEVDAAAAARGGGGDSTLMRRLRCDMEACREQQDSAEAQCLHLPPSPPPLPSHPNTDARVQGLCALTRTLHQSE